MEYTFKLSEIIAGCESGAWLEGAMFIDETGVCAMFNGEYLECSVVISVKNKWGFYGY